MWTRAVLEVLEQSVGLPGEISEMVLQHLQRQCTAYGCQTLNQLQLMLRVSGKAETVLELFLQRLDEYANMVSKYPAHGGAVKRSLLRKYSGLPYTVAGYGNNNG